MSARLREIARQTVAIIEAGGYANPAGRYVDIASAVEEAIAGTRHYLPEMSALATVADAFGEALAEVGGVDHVVFAILDKLRGAPVRAAFEARFAGRSV